jgi:hypothetical protein
MTRTVRQTAWLLAAGTLGLALQTYDASPNPVAMAWLTASITLTLLGLFAPAWPLPASLPRWAAAVVLVAQLAAYLSREPGKHLDIAAATSKSFHLGMAAALFWLVTLLRRPTRWHRPALLGLAGLFGVWFLRHSPRPHIDVYEFQDLACRALAEGGNPYALRFTNIYGDASPFYAPGLSVNGVLQFGFIYPPLTLLLDWPAWWLFGDFRAALWTAFVLTGAGALWLGRTPTGGHPRIGWLAAAVLLFTPRGLFIVEQGWTEPLVLAGLAATLLTARHRPQALPWVLGLFLQIKQYLVLAVPLVPLLLPQPWTWRQLRAVAWRALAVVVALNLPFLLWSPADWWRSVAMVQVLQPFRADSLSYLALWSREGQPPITPSVAFLAAAVGLGLAWWKAPRTPAGFAGGVALVFLLFLAFGKQSFWNYDLLPLGALLLAVAADDGGAADDGEEATCS